MTSLDLKLHPKQFKCFTSKATEILYGGAAGGGKSHILRVIAIALASSVPGIQIYLFRRLSDDLTKNHVYGPTGFLALLNPLIQKGVVKYTSRPDEFTWVETGAKIFLCHCQHEKDVSKYQGAELHVLFMDELTHFTEFQYRFLRNRVRLGGLKIPDAWKDKLPLILCGSNPGSVGHAWVKATFINNVPPYEIYRTAPSEGGMLRQYIPAKLEDNPTLLINDPNYENRLTGLGSPDLVRAMRDGDWDIVAGAAFENLRRDVHAVRPFRIPHWWTKYTCMDWGTAKPYSVGWYAVADEDLLIKATDEWPEKLIGKGSVIRYKELYGWNGNPDIGTREEAWQVADKIHALETPEDEITYRIADSAMWAQHDGPSAAENMIKRFHEIGAMSPVMEKSRKDRAANYLEIRNRLSKSNGEEPGFYAFDSCFHFWRTIPELQLDAREPEKGWDTGQEDHCFTAETIVITRAGGKPISKIKNGEGVLTAEGYKTCYKWRKPTKKHVYKVTLSDGYTFNCTANHPILTSGGMYVRLDNLQVGDKVCVLKCLPIESKDGTIKTIGFVANTTNAVASVCIELFGSITTALSQMVTTFITKTKTVTTTILKTLNYYIKANICDIICMKGFQLKKACKRIGNQLNWQLNQLGLGIPAKKEKNGTAKRQKAESTLLNTIKHANAVECNLKQQLIKQNIVPTNAVLPLGELTILSITALKAKKSVYNLSVPEVEHYCLGNGLIVHNCADELAYSLVSRPMLMDRNTYINQKYDEAQEKALEAERGGKKNKSRY